MKPGSTSSFGTPIGGGGFTQPKPSSNNFGSLSNKGSTFGSSSSSSFGNSNFGGSSSNFGGSKSKSNLLGTAGAGLTGGLVGGALGKSYKKNPWGVNQYSGFSKPKKSFGSHLFGSKKKSYGYKTPGYGTNWGTNFAGGMGQYKKPKKGISKKG